MRKKSILRSIARIDLKKVRRKSGRNCIQGQSDWKENLSDEIGLKMKISSSYRKIWVNGKNGQLDHLQKMEP